MIIFIGMVAMEFMGLLALAGISILGAGQAPWALPVHAALPVAFAIGAVATYVLGRVMGLIDVGQIDVYRARVDTMHAMGRGGYRTRGVHRAPRRSVVIEY